MSAECCCRSREESQQGSGQENRVHIGFQTLSQSPRPSLDHLAHPHSDLQLPVLCPCNVAANRLSEECSRGMARTTSHKNREPAPCLYSLRSSNDRSSFRRFDLMVRISPNRVLPLQWDELEAWG